MRTFQKVPLFSPSSTEYFPNSLWITKIFFLANVRRASVFFLVSSGFRLGTLPWMPFLPSLFLIVESWTLTLTEASEAFSALEVVLDELLIHSWSNSGRPASPGKVHHCSMFSPIVDNGSHWGSLESQSLGNGFVTLSRLIDVNCFVSHLFLNFFGSGWCVAFLRSFGLLYVVRRSFRKMWLITVNFWFKKGGQLHFHIGSGWFG